MYRLSKRFHLGLTVEGEHQPIYVKNGTGKFGDLNTIALLPTIEMRPFDATSIIPYFSAGLGVNINSFTTASGVPDIKHENTPATRFAGGIDIPLNSHWMFNTELAWRSNKGDSTQLGATIPFNASALLGLIGLRYGF
jgi:hypothetical protein